MSGTTPTAYQMFFGPSAATEHELQDQERQFFVSVRLPNGTYKTTNSRRMDDLNRLVNANLPASRPLCLMDVAISSGVSTAEWLQSLEGIGVQCEMVAGDLTVRGFIISAGLGLRVLTDAAGTPMQFDVRGRAVRVDAGRRERTLYALPLMWLRLASGVVRHFGGAAMRNAQDKNGLRIAGFDVQPVRLLSRRLGVFKNLTVVDDDISVSGRFTQQFHVLRAANILNLVYFDRTTLSMMVTNLQRRLKLGGLLVICRTVDSGVNHATLFRKCESGQFEVVTRLNDGSEIEDLVLASGPGI